VIVFLVVLILVLLALLVGCYCRRRRNTQKVEFEIFTNENISSKDTKIESNNVTHPIPVIEKDINDISKEDSDNSTNESKRKRRRKKDRLTHNREVLNE
jgi:hypothetical protein